MSTICQLNNVIVYVMMVEIHNIQQRILFALLLSYHIRFICFNVARLRPFTSSIQIDILLPEVSFTDISLLLIAPSLVVRLS